MSTTNANSDHVTSSNLDRWAPILLRVSAVQCVIWGIFIVVVPERASLVYGFAQPPAELFLWQGIGLVIVLFGIGYAIASYNPLQHWCIVLLGFLGKSLGPVGMSWSVFQGRVSSRVLYLIPVNDLIWLIPFALILVEVYRKSRKSSSPTIAC